MEEDSPVERNADNALSFSAWQEPGRDHIKLVQKSDAQYRLAVVRLTQSVCTAAESASRSLVTQRGLVIRRVTLAVFASYLVPALLLGLPRALRVGFLFDDLRATWYPCFRTINDIAAINGLVGGISFLLTIMLLTRADKHFSVKLNPVYCGLLAFFFVPYFIHCYLDGSFGFVSGPNAVRCFLDYFLVRVSQIFGLPGLLGGVSCLAAIMISGPLRPQMRLVGSSNVN